MVEKEAHKSDDIQLTQNPNGNFWLRADLKIFDFMLNIENCEMEARSYLENILEDITFSKY